MDPTECQKQLAHISSQILALETRARLSQMKGVPFSETSRLEFFEFLRDQFEKKCVSVRYR